MIVFDRQRILMVTFIAVGSTSHLHHSWGSKGSGAMDSRPLSRQAGPGGWCWWRWRWCPRCQGRSPCRQGAGRGTGQTWWRSPRPPWRGSPAVSEEASGRDILVTFYLSLINTFGSQHHWIETEHWQTQHFLQEHAVQNILVSLSNWKHVINDPKVSHLRHTATITLRNRERRPKEMILPIGSGWKTVPRNSPLFWQRPNTLSGVVDGLY